MGICTDDVVCDVGRGGSRIVSNDESHGAGIEGVSYYWY